LLRHQQFGRDIASPSSGGHMDASRWRLTVAEPATLEEQLHTFGALQATLDAFSPPLAFTLTGEAVAAAEVEAGAPPSAVGWAAWAVAAAACACFCFFDPAAVLLLLLALLHTALCLLGALTLLPASGAAPLAWVAVALPHSLHALALSVSSLVRSPGDELDALALLAPPLLRSSACSLLLLLPGLIVFPLPYVRSLLILLLASLLLVLLEALLVLPLLHAILRPRLRPSSSSAAPAPTTRLKPPQAAPSYNTL
jgi:hypothetical protein